MWVSNGPSLGSLGFAVGGFVHRLHLGTVWESPYSSEEMKYRMTSDLGLCQTEEATVAFFTDFKEHMAFEALLLSVMFLT